MLHTLYLLFIAPLDFLILITILGSALGISAGVLIGSFIKNEYVNCLESLVRKKFDKSISFEDSYSTFATEFWMHLEKITPEQLRSINNLKSWLFIVAKNFIYVVGKTI